MAILKVVVAVSVIIDSVATVPGQVAWQIFSWHCWFLAPHQTPRTQDLALKIKIKHSQQLIEF